MEKAHGTLGLLRPGLWSDLGGAHIPLALAAKGILDLHLPPGVHFLGAAGPILAALIVCVMAA